MSTPFPKPEQCALWRSPEVVRDSHEIFEAVVTYQDESDHRRVLLKCRECGHLYFYEMYEPCHWGDDDPVYRTYIPVASAEQATEVAALSVWDVARCAPAIHENWSRGKDRSEIFWTGRKDESTRARNLGGAPQGL
jgi:hypothetical protein